ncbi:MAG: hypothetical protein H8E73_03060, partial [Planctomycetes bacterium]|nr:hypothetical protein [Planctomycetota bacterium]
RGSLGGAFVVTGLAALVAGGVAKKIPRAVLRSPQLQSIGTLIRMGGIRKGGFFVWGYNILNSRRTERPFALEMKAAVESLPHERIAFWHKCEDKTLFMELDPPITLLTDESDLREFLKSDRPGVIISQERYVRGTAASMLPSQPMWAETIYAWESHQSQQEKLKAWLTNPGVSRIAAESEEANDAK